jgi:hypothetical protein
MAKEDYKSYLDLNKVSREAGLFAVHNPNYGTTSNVKWDYQDLQKALNDGVSEVYLLKYVNRAYASQLKLCEGCYETVLFLDKEDALKFHEEQKTRG